MYVSVCALFQCFDMWYFDYPSAECEQVFVLHCVECVGYGTSAKSGFLRQTCHLDAHGFRSGRCGAVLFDEMHYSATCVGGCGVPQLACGFLRQCRDVVDEIHSEDYEFVGDAHQVVLVYLHGVACCGGYEGACIVQLQSECAFGLQHVWCCHVFLNRVAVVIGVNYRLGLSVCDKREPAARVALFLDNVASCNLAERELGLSDDLQQIVAGESLE